MSLGNLETNDLLRHSGWMHRMARRLVGEGLGDDLVQETWLAALERPPNEPRAVVSWLQRVLRNRAHSTRSRDGSRRRREISVARREATAEEPGQHIERLEVQRQIVDAVLDLREPLREAIYFRFFDEQTAHEIADRLGVSVSTVRHRLRQGLEELRRRLDDSYGDRRSWSLALAPLVAEPIESLAASTTISTSTSASTAATAAIHGGTIVSKKLIVISSFVALAALSTGIGVGTRLSTADEVTPEELAALSERARRSEALSKELADLRAEFDLGQKALAESRHQAAVATEELERQRRELDRLARARSKAEADALDRAAATDIESSAIDWDHLYALFEDNLDLASKVATLLENGEDPTQHLSSADLAKLGLLQAELQKAAALARAESPQPFFDDAILPEYLRVLLGAPLGLDEKQMDTLIDVASEAIADVRVDESLPLELIREREQVVAKIHEQLEASLDPEQRATWESVSSAVDSLLKGPAHDYRYGLKRPGTVDSVLDYWKRHYAYENLDAPTVREIAEGYLGEAKALLESRQAMGKRFESLDADTQRALEAEFFDLQIRAETRLLDLLSDEALDDLVGKQPARLLFDDSHNVRRSEEDAPGL